MKQSRNPASFATITLLLLIGTGAIIRAFWLLDHPLAAPGTWTTITILLGVFFVSYTWALF